MRASLLIVALLIVVGGLTWLMRGEGTPPTRIRNVVLISIDTCRADHLGCYGSDQNTTPNMDALASDAVVFTRAHSTNPITLPAHCSMLTGTYPPYHGVHDNNNYRLGPSNLTLAEILQDHGLQTAAFVAAFPLDSRFGVDQGFATYNDRFSPPHNKSQIAERKAAEVSGEAISWLESHGQNDFFLFLHYFDPHALYNPPEQFASKHPRDSYAGEIAYTDDCIGQVIDKLKSLGFFDSTLIIITADHAESLDEHGEKTHAYYIYESTIRVPLIVRTPHGIGKTMDDPVSIVDVVPTVLGQLGIDAPPTVRGRDILGEPRQQPPLEADRYLYCESIYPTRFGCTALHGLVRGKWKFIWTVRPELYDLVSDPAEAENLVEREPQIAAEFQKQLKHLLATQTRRNDADNRLTMDQQGAQRLRSLGYVGGAAPRISLEIDAASRDPKDYLDLHQHIMTAYTRYSERNYPQARMECLQVLKRQPGNLAAHMMLGDIFTAEGRNAEAAAHFSQYLIVAAKLNSTGSQQDVRRDVKTFQAHTKLAQVFWSLGSSDSALSHLQLALQSGEESPQMHFQLGVVLAAQGKLSEAVDHYRDALRLRADYAEAHFQLGLLLARQQQTDEAREHLIKSRSLEKRHAEAMNNEAWRMATHPDASARDPQAAVLLAEIVVASSDNPKATVLDTLAAAYAAAGQFDRAVATADKALALVSTSSDDAHQKQLIRAIRQRRELYLSSKPFIETRSTPEMR